MENIEEIIEKCKNGQSKAQEQLFKMFAPKMLGLCYRYLSSLDDAHDAMQDGFVKVFLNIHKYEGKSSFRTWITRIMMNVAIDHIKQSNKFKFSSYDVEDYSENVADEDDWVDDLNIDQKTLLKFINQLPTGYKTVFNMYAIDGMSHKEISNTLKITEGTSKSQLNRARQYLKNEIKKYQELNS